IDKGEPEAAPGTIILVLGSDPKKVRKAALTLVNAGAAGVIVVRKADPAYFEEAARQLPESAIHLQGETRSALAVELNFLEVSGDGIYNGGGDDASGPTDELELVRVLGGGLRAEGKDMFALLASEEVGGVGSLYFCEHTPIPLRDLAADLEFAIIGRPDSAVR